MKMILKNIKLASLPSLARFVQGALLPLLCAPLLQAQTVILQDKFTYTASNINSHAPTLCSGTETWFTKFATKNPSTANISISANGSEAVIDTGEENPYPGEAFACLPFTPATNTIYTLTAVYHFPGPMGIPRDCWIGMGFSTSKVGGGNGKAPWMFVRPQKNPTENPQACGNDGATKSISGNVPASAYAGPIVATIKWNTGTGQAQYFINGELQPSWTATTPLPTGQHYIYFTAFHTVRAVNVKSITLTAESIKAD